MDKNFGWKTEQILWKTGLNYGNQINFNGKQNQFMENRTSLWKTEQKKFMENRTNFMENRTCGFKFKHLKLRNIKFCFP